MDYKDLIALKTVQEEGSITKASARLYVSQPSLTKRIKKLETEFGVKILNRSPEGSLFTAQGDHILNCAIEMLAKIDRTKDYVRSMESKMYAPLKLGVSFIYAQYELAPILSNFKKLFPLVKVDLKTGLSSLLVHELQKDEITVAILRGNYEWSENNHLLNEEPFCIISPQQITDEYLLNFPWIKFESDWVPFMSLCEAWWGERFSSPPNYMQVRNHETCLHMVSNGIGWTIAPEICIRKNRSLFTCPVIFKNGEYLMRQTRLLYKNSALECQAAKVFIDMVLAIKK